VNEARSHLALPPRFFGVSLKMYFGHAQTLNWCERVAAWARRSPALVDGEAALAVLPTFTALSEAVSIFAGTNVQVGAQDLFWQDQGAFTGEVGGPELSEIGCRFVEVGHAERRGLLGESDSVVARKVAAAVRNNMTPILCVGEPERSSADKAAAWCTSQLETAIGPESGLGPRHAAGVIVAYEPIWAIGASVPAPADHIVSVCVAIRRWLAESSLGTSRLIYGGSARAGLLSQLDGCTDGLFLGRSVHDPDNLGKILAEAT
jgi:triosephosphate isomerase